VIYAAFIDLRLERGAMSTRLVYPPIRKNRFESIKSDDAQFYGKSEASGIANRSLDVVDRDSATVDGPQSDPFILDGLIMDLRIVSIDL
jgi:hypothetical protein